MRAIRINGSFIISVKNIPQPRISVFLVLAHCRRDATRSQVVNTLHNILSPDKKFKGLKIYLIGLETVRACGGRDQYSEEKLYNVRGVCRMTVITS